MANYENGLSTQQMIIQACKSLFYHKGYHETSYEDICQTAHVNRSTIYYHFKTKEAMRYEVMWEYTRDHLQVADRYCTQQEYRYILAVCLMWKSIKIDANIRNFIWQGWLDYPVLTGKLDFSHYYTTLYDNLFGAFFCKNQISELSFASVYGYMMCCMRMLCEETEKYDPMDLFKQCISSSASIWGIPAETMDQIWAKVQYYLSLIPEEEMRIRLP